MLKPIAPNAAIRSIREIPWPKKWAADGVAWVWLPEFVAGIEEPDCGDGGVRVGISSAGGDEFDVDGGIGGGGTVVSEGNLLLS